MEIMFDKYKPVRIEYPGEFPTGPVLFKLSEFVQDNGIGDSSFIKVASEALESNNFNAEEKKELYHTVEIASKEGVLDKKTSEVYRIIEDSRKKGEPAYNTPWFWSLAILFVGSSIIGIVITSYLLSSSGNTIPEFFSTSIGALIGVLVSLFAGWSQSK